MTDLLPTAFAEDEGGYIQPWTGGPVSGEWLSGIRRELSVSLQGRRVYALYFGERRWDSVNGWTE